ncbi:hypothetical protein Tco_1157548, partial [Tanacetum coccineum]
QHATPPNETTTSAPTTQEPQTSALDLLDFASIFKFNERIFNLEQEVSQLKQDNKVGYAIQTTFHSYKLDKDLFDTYGEAYSLKRDRDDKDKDEDPSVGSDRGKKRRKSGKEAEPSQEPKSRSSKSTSSSKGPTQSLCKSSEFVTGNTDDQPADEAISKDDWWKKPEKPLTPDRDWNKRQSVDFRSSQTWISNIAKDKETPSSFDELMNTPIDFSAFVMNRLQIENLTQEILVGPAFDLLKGTCKSFVKLGYHFEEVFKVVHDRLDWNNPEGNVYPFDLSKPLPLTQDDRGRQVILVDYFINNDLLYLQGGSASRKYTTSTTKTKVATYDNVLGIEDMILNLWSSTKMFTRRIVILKRVEDLQLGVKSYQRMLKRNRLMRLDELYKFCDGTLTDVRSVLDDITKNQRMEYLPKRDWSRLDRQRSRIMIKKIDELLFERRLMRNLERFVRGREYRNDFRLLERTI